MSADQKQSVHRRNAMIPDKKPMGSNTNTRRMGIASFTDIQALQPADQEEASGPQVPQQAPSGQSLLSHQPIVQPRLEDQLTNEKLRELEIIFEEADEDGGGGLDMDEFRNAMRKAMGEHLTDTELDQLFMKVDTNCDGTVDWDEYLSYMLLEYREKDQMNMDSKKKPFPRHMKHVNHTCKYQRHSDAMIQIRFAPAVLKVNNVLFRSVDDGSGRYITVSKEGIINFWTQELKHLKNFKIERHRPTQNQQGSLWVTSLSYMYNLNIFAVSTTACDVTFYTTLHNRITPVRCIVDMEICLTCMDYWVNPAHTAHAVLLLGDARGNVYGLTFKFCDTACFFNTSTTSPTQLNVSMSDVLAGKYCCVSGIMLPRVHKDFVLKIKYVPELQKFISCCRDRSTAVFSGDLRQLKKTYYKVRKGIFDFAYCRKNNVIVTGGKDTIVRVWNPYVCSKPVILLHGHKSAVIHVIVNEREEHVVSISEDKDINVFDMATQVCVQTIARQWVHLGPRPITAAFFNPYRQSLILATNKLAYFEHEEAEIQQTNIKSHITPSNVVIYNPLFDQLISGSTDSLVCVWDIHTGKRTMQFYAHKKIYLGKEVTEDITAMKLDPTKRRLATAARDGVVRIWNFNNGALLRDLDVFDSHEVSSIVWERGRIITAGWNRRLNVYMDSADDSTVTHFKCRHYEDILAMVYVGSSTVVSASYDGDILCWSLDTGRLMYRLNAKTGDNTILDEKPSNSKKSVLKSFAEQQESRSAHRYNGMCSSSSRLRSRRMTFNESMKVETPTERRLPASPHRKLVSPRTVPKTPNRNCLPVATEPPLLEQDATDGMTSPQATNKLVVAECDNQLSSNSMKQPVIYKRPNRRQRKPETETSVPTLCVEPPKLNPEERKKCLDTLAGLVRKRQARKRAWDKGLALAANAKETSIEKLLFLETRGTERKTACLVATGAGGWVRFWSLHPDSGLLGEFCAVHNPGDSILTMTTDTCNTFLITGDTSGYIKIWFIEMYCNETVGAFSSDTWIPRRPDGIPSHMEQTFPFLSVTDKAKRKLCPIPGIHPSREPNSKLFGAPPMINSFRGHLQAISCVEYIEEKRYIVSCSSDCSIRLWTVSGEFIGIFGQDVPWNCDEDGPESNLPTATSSSTGISSVLSVKPSASDHFTPGFSHLARPEAAPRKLPADIKKVASSTTMRVLYGGLRPHWKLAKNIVLIWIPMLRNTRRPLELADLVNKEVKFEESDYQPYGGAGDEQRNILGKSYKSGRNHKPLPKLSKFRCFQNQVDVFSSLPYHELAKLDIRCSTPQIIKEAREAQKALDRHKRLHIHMHKAKNLARMMRMSKQRAIPGKNNSVTLNCFKPKGNSILNPTVRSSAVEQGSFLPQKGVNMSRAGSTTTVDGC